MSEETTSADAGIVTFSIYLAEEMKKARVIYTISDFLKENPVDGETFLDGVTRLIIIALLMRLLYGEFPKNRKEKGESNEPLNL